MKKILFTILAAVALLTSCNREVIVEGGKGILSFDLNFKLNMQELVTKADMTEDEITDALIIDIVRPSDGYARPSTPYGELRGKAIELGAGSYTITASSPQQEAAAYDQPIFYGTNSFDIRLGQATQTSLECTIQNSKVTILIAEGFHQELSSYTISVTNGIGNPLLWTKTSTESDFLPDEESGNTVYKGKKAGYFKPAPLTITVNGYRGDGAEATLTRKITDVKAADHHVIKFDADVTGSLGDIAISISDKVNRIDEDVVVEGFDEIPVEGDKPAEDNGDNGDNGDSGDNGGTETPGPSTAPTLEWLANPTFTDVDLPMSPDAVVDVELLLNAPEGVKEFLIYVESVALTETIAALTEAGEDGIVNGVATMDMINDDVLYDNLGTTLPMKDEVLNKTSVEFSMSSLVPMINLYADSITPGDRHTFTLRVVDNADQILEQPVTFVSVAAN